MGVVRHLVNQDFDFLSLDDFRNLRGEEVGDGGWHPLGLEGVETRTGAASISKSSETEGRAEG